MKQEEIKNIPNENISSSVPLLNAILAKTDGFVRHLDVQTNILMGVSSAIFIFSASQIKNNEWWIFFLIIASFSAVSSLVSLLAVHPPRFMRKRNQKESLMYNKKIAGTESPGDYAKQLGDILGDEKKITEQFSIEIYNLCKYYYRPKRKLFNASRNILFLGLVLSIISFLIDLIYTKII